MTSDFKVEPEIARKILIFARFLKQSQNKKGLKFVSAATKVISFFTAVGAEKRHHLV